MQWAAVRTLAAVETSTNRC